MEIDVKFEKIDQTFDTAFSESDQEFETDMGEVIMVHDGAEYEGPYEVIPKVEAQTLETAGKIMKKDVAVKAIPIYEVSNTSGGSTVYIAKDIVEI